MQNLQQSRRPAGRGRGGFRAFIAARRELAGRAAGGDRCSRQGWHAAGCHDRQRRVEDLADREIDTARGRGPGRAPLRHVAARPHHRPAGRGGELDAVPRLLHPSAHRRDGRRQPRPDGGAARRWAQSRPDPHGRGVQHRQPRPTRLDVRLAHPRGDLRAGAAASGQPTTARAVRGQFGSGTASSSDGQFFQAGGLRPRRQPI